MSEDKTKTKFSTSILAITGLIVAISGLLTVLHTTGVINLKGNTDTKTEQVHDPNAAENNKVEVIIKREDEPQKITPEKELETNTIKNYQPVTNRQDSNQIETNYATYNLSGYWYENQQGSRYYFNQNVYGNITFQEYAYDEYGNTFISAEGSGSMQNNQISVVFLSYLGYTGTFNGAIQNNGNTIDGVATVQATGQTLRIVMHKE